MNNEILIIEDDLELRNNLELILRNQGFCVSGVGCAAEFYRIIETVKFDLVIVDIGLPDKNDFELVEYLCKKTSSKIIILSARESVEDRVSGYGAGADIYFVKPVESIELIAAINNIYNKICMEETRDETFDKWIFEQSNWMLIAPNNKRMILTSKEGMFIATIMRDEGVVVPRSDILLALDYDVNNIEDNNSLDVLVARVRRKCKTKCGVELPLKTVRMHGYLFDDVFSLV